MTGSMQMAANQKKKFRYLQHPLPCLCIGRPIKEQSVPPGMPKLRVSVCLATYLSIYIPR